MQNTSIKFPGNTGENINYLVYVVLGEICQKISSPSDIRYFLENIFHKFHEKILNLPAEELRKDLLKTQEYIIKGFWNIQ